MKSRKLSILLADTNQTNIALFKKTIILLNVNCELFVTTDGEALISYINSINKMPNYIFLDINLPNISGLNCLSYIKTKHPSNTFYIIMTTNKICQHTLNDCYRYGANCIIDKDIDEDFFINILDYCFRKIHETVLQKEFILNKIVAKSSTLGVI